MAILKQSDFDCDAVALAKKLLGKVIRSKYQESWLSAQIIETEAYYLVEKGSHASLGFTEKRKALFMPPGTIYMYYARGADSLNVSAKGEGNAVLIKSAIPYLVDADESRLHYMQQLNPVKGSGKIRSIERLCSGQTLLCRSLNLKVIEWDQQQFDSERFFIEDVGYQPKAILTAPRLGIPPGRDEHLPYRFYDAHYIKSTTLGR